MNRLNPGNPLRHPAKEDDEVEILSGIFEGVTTGTPIGLMVRNQDQNQKTIVKSRIYTAQLTPLPMTASMAFAIIAVVVAPRRETTVRVATGAVAETGRALWRADWGLPRSVGAAFCGAHDWDLVGRIFCGDAALVPQLEAYMRDLIKQGDSVGARINVEAKGVPAGWGEPVLIASTPILLTR